MAPGPISSTGGPRAGVDVVTETNPLVALPVFTNCLTKDKNRRRCSNTTKRKLILWGKKGHKFILGTTWHSHVIASQMNAVPYRKNALVGKGVKPSRAEVGEGEKS